MSAERKPRLPDVWDLLLYATRGIAIANCALREKHSQSKKASRFIIDALFTTITNADFDNDMLDGFIRRAFELKNILCGQAKKEGIGLPALPEVEFHATPEDYEKSEPFTGVLSETDEDIRGLKQLADCKGMAAYARHALNLGYED